MKTVILDTNFILICLKEKIDFFNEIFLMGMKIIIPRQVINELEKIIGSKQKLHVREQAVLALRFIKNNRDMWIKKDFSKYGRTTDKGIINFSKGRSDIIIATLDKELKKKTRNPKLVIRGKNHLEVI